MAKEKSKPQAYTEVWGDTVNLKELAISSVIGIVLTLVFYLIGTRIFANVDGLEPSLAKGYSLLVGVLGCIIAAVISAKCFKPKRIIEERSTVTSLKEVLANANMTFEEEAEALSTVSPDIIKELEDLEMWSLLSLIPEGTPNYKPEYRQYAQVSGDPAQEQEV